MNLKEAYIPKGHPNRCGTKLEALKAIVVHYTGNDNPSMGDEAGIKWMGRKYLVRDGKFMEMDGTAFRYGSAHVFCDCDSVSLGIPTDEVAWACGDNRRGQTTIASKVFANRQNYQTISVEICNNKEWDKAVLSAKEWIVDFLVQKELGVDIVSSLNPDIVRAVEPGTVLLLRHYDLTRKICPKPFVEDVGEWETFVRFIAYDAEGRSGK